MPGKNHFQLKWCDIPDFCSWLRPCSDICLAHCSVCKKDFRIDNAGVANVRSHAKGKGHISAIKLQAKNKQLSIQTMMCGKSTGGAESAFSSAATTTTAPDTTATSTIAADTASTSTDAVSIVTSNESQPLVYIHNQ